MKINKGVMCCVCLGTVIAILGISMIMRPRTKVVTDNNSNEKGKEVQSEIPINTLENMPTETYRIENGTVIFEENIKKITRDMFHNNDEILHITLPETIEEIEHGSFAESNLKTIDMSKAKCGLSDFLFERCNNLESVILPRNLTFIPISTFERCKCLKEIVIPDTVTCIASDAFSGCKNMKYIDMGDHLEEIGITAFRDCKSLQDVIFPQSVEKILYFAFSYCESLKYITIPEKIKTMEDGAFAGCVNLMAVTIGKCETFEEDVFCACDKLTIYGLAGTAAQTYAKENNILFEILSMKEETVTLKANDTYQLELNSKAICDWSTSDDTIVSVDENGMVTAKQAGTAIVTASIYGENFTCEVTVE